MGQRNRKGSAASADGGKANNNGKSKKSNKSNNDTGTEQQQEKDDGVMISIPNDALYHDLTDNNGYFDNLVDMIPAKLYISGNTGDEMYNPKYKRGQHKESKEARRARNKAAKLKKFHPELSETTRQAKARLAREKEEEADGSGSDSDDSVAEGGKAGKKRRMKKDKAAAASAKRTKKTAGAWAEDSDNDDTNDDDGAMEMSTPDLSNEKSVDRTAEDVVPPGASRIEALRAKLRAKIAERQASRPGGAPAPDAVSKRAARRAEKQRRIEAAKKRAEAGGSTRVGKNDVAPKKYKVADNLGGTVFNAGSAGASSSKDQDLAGVDFGGIAGLSKKATYLDNKSLAKSGGKKKSLDRLLADAEKKRDRLHELKQGSEEDKEKAARIMWGDTLKEASGERVRDDPALIKKAMKRKAKKKAKSAKAWASRVEQLEDAKDQRQKIRSHNLDKRKLGGAVAANLSRKRIVTEEDKEDKDNKEKRPRLGPYSKGKGDRAGFEGKRTTFINEVKGKGSKQ